MKFTPLNIVLSCILVWFISEWNAPQGSAIAIGWLILLVFIIALLDLGFRYLFKDVKRLWVLQIGFILVVSVLVIILKLL